jgi:hypothetical protein
MRERRMNFWSGISQLMVSLLGIEDCLDDFDFPQPCRINF